MIVHEQAVQHQTILDFRLTKSYPKFSIWSNIKCLRYLNTAWLRIFNSELGLGKRLKGKG
ncbi:hypothetical protein NIES3275_01050 [Microchaete diplosiphon NIES-3275]|nr:hypothetical protein NIES3275_01050 [Microchaete diplosiphon NIES-3275]